jgi:adenylate cyclase
MDTGLNKPERGIYMNQNRTKRKLTAILSTDVVGYSRMMEADEAWTIQSLEENKRLISKLVEEYEGRVVDAPGDNLLAEFNSVVNAVECAVKIQQQLKKKNDNLVESRRMIFRIGVNLGDVIEEDGKIFGNGVNIAARLEGLAEPGGICISRTAFDQVSTKLDLGYEFLGEHNVKNITVPVRVYRVLTDSKSAGKVIGEKKVTQRQPRLIITSTIIVIIIAAGLTGWIIYSHQSQKISPTSPIAGKTPAASDLKVHPKTIAVLPFENLSPEKDQEYFADGIAEELLNDLTRIKELEVRGRTSSFYFKGKNETLQTISKMLDVEYILEGSVRKVDKKVRITVQLINTREDKHLWSETYDRTLDDIFTIQDSIAQSVADAMQITLGVGELGNTPGMTKNIAAYDAYLAGLSFSRQLGREGMSRAIEQLEKAVTIAPDFAIGWDVLSSAYNGSLAFIPEKSEEYRQKATVADSRVIELIPESDLALGIKASRSGDWVEVERLYKKAITLNPTNYELYGSYGWFLIVVGRPTEAIAYFERYRQSDPLLVGAYLGLGDAYDLLGNFDASAKAYKKAKDLTREPLIYNLGLLALAVEMNNRTLIDEYAALVSPTEAFGKNSISDSFDTRKDINYLLDNPEKALDELRRQSNDPTFKNMLGRISITLMASYFGDHELALRVYKENGSPIYSMWRPIHKEMRRLPGFKDLVRDFGLVDYWRKSGNWGDYCKPVGDNDFECE